jgi:predicted Zn finger-like uncharacterized protein
MFKVECLGCQAPYQVDERRVPEKGLKMRCPKCGTSFKVEPPSQALPSEDDAPAPPADTGLQPVPTPKPFASAGMEPERNLNKPPASTRGGLSRTMIGVSAADLAVLTKAFGQDPNQPKGFRIPLPNAPAPELEEAVALPELVQPKKRALGFEAAATSALSLTERFALRDDVGADLDPDAAALPAVFGQSRATDAARDAPWVAETQAVLSSSAPKPDADWAAEPAPALLASSAARGISDLPSPFVVPERSKPPSDWPALIARPAASHPELDLGNDLPVAVSPPVRRPPPRRPRPAQVESSAPGDDTLDLPARLEDLEVGLPSLGASRAPPPRGSRRAPGPHKSSGLDELDLPAIAARDATPSGLAAPRPPARDGMALDLPMVMPPRRDPPAQLPATAASRRETRADLPTLQRSEIPGELPVVMPPRQQSPVKASSVTREWEAPRELLDLDLPAVGRGAPKAGRADAPADFNDLPDIFAGGLPDRVDAGLPSVSSTGLPELVSVGLPDVSASGLPDLAHAGLPDVLASGLPGLNETGLPMVSAQGVKGFGRMDLPVAREAGLPEIKPGAMGLVEMDLPGVGEALPSLLQGGAWDETNLPLVGESLPSTRGGVHVEHARRDGSARPSFGDDMASAEADSFGNFGSDPLAADPFSGLEADFGSDEPAQDPFANGEVGDAFGSVGDAPSHAALADFDSGAAPDDAGFDPGAGYGEVDIAGHDLDAGGALETTDDMEFRAIPQRNSVAPGRAAASASVHPDGSDADTTGSTLELGPERKSVPRARTRRTIAALTICTSVIAGGALALKPDLGPFGIHFIMDQLKRGEHERLLVQLIDEGRRGMRADTLEATRTVLSGLDAAGQLAPRFEPLQARAVFAQYYAVLRFGPLPELEAAAKAGLERIDPSSPVVGHRLARAARALQARAPEAKVDLLALGNDPDARQLLGDLALQTSDYAAALKIWTELAKEQPDSARAAFGLGQAQLGLDEPAAALAQGRRVLAINPRHVGAQILMLEAERAVQSTGVERPGAGEETASLLAAVQAALPRAAPGEVALTHAVLGELHLSQGRNGPAQHAFEEALAVDRNFPRALIGLGETLDLAGRHAEALARFEAAAERQPESLRALLGVAKSQIQLVKLPEAKAIFERLTPAHKAHPDTIYWMAKAEQALGALDAALLGYRASIEAGKGRAGNVRAYLALARLQAELGQLALAQQTLTEARDKLPPSGQLYNALGEMALNGGQYQEAHAQFQKALGVDADDTRARFMSAVALARLGRFNEALTAFQSVGDKDKDFPGLAIERGRLFEEAGRNAEALKEYEAAFLEAPEDPDLQIRVGCGRVMAGRGTTAEELLEKALKARPRSADAFYCLGRAFFDQGRLVDADNRFDRALGLDPNRAVYQLYAGWVASEMGRSTEAEAALDRALELDKGLADAYWQRGRLRLKQGAVKDAVRDLERALELKPSRREAQADVAMAYADLGRLPQALRAWEEAIGADPDNATWHFRYGKLLSASGNGAEAAAHLRRAVDLVTEQDAALPPATAAKPPIWLWQAHYLLGRELGLVGAAVPHWQAYMRLSPRDDPYRPEAERALEALGQPWNQH